MLFARLVRSLRRPVLLCSLMTLGACGHPSGHSDPRPEEPAPVATAKPLKQVVNTKTGSGETVVKKAEDQPAEDKKPDTPVVAASVPPAPAPGDAAPAAAVAVPTKFSDAFDAKCSICHGDDGRSGSAGKDLKAFAGGFAAYEKIVRAGILDAVATATAGRNVFKMPAAKVAKYPDSALADDFTFLTGKAAQ